MEENHNVMTEEEFQNELKNKLNLRTFECARGYRSVIRAYKRGHITNYGEMVPNKPFNNRPNRSKRKGVHSRAYNEFKKAIYNDYLFKEKYHGRRV